MLGNYAYAASKDSAFQEMRLRLSRCQRLLDNFTTEISIEMALGGQGAQGPDEAPLVRLAAQLAF